MLMRLQEAANYSNNNQDQESDCASLDSNMTQDSFAGSDREWDPLVLRRLEEDQHYLDVLLESRNDVE